MSFLIYFLASDRFYKGQLFNIYNHKKVIILNFLILMLKNLGLAINYYLNYKILKQNYFKLIKENQQEFLFMDLLIQIIHFRCLHYYQQYPHYSYQNVGVKLNYFKILKKNQLEFLSIDFFIQIKIILFKYSNLNQQYQYYYYQKCWVMIFILGLLKLYLSILSLV